jgi:hypothetical protein
MKTKTIAILKFKKTKIIAILKLKKNHGHIEIKK